MAITTMDQLLASFLPPEDFAKEAFTGEAAGQYHSSLYLAGRPGAAAAPTPGMAGAALTSYAGQVPFPASQPSESVYLARVDGAQAGNIGTILLLDRLWHNSGIAVTTTTAQTVSSVALPARDSGGTTDGEDVGVALEVTTATTNASAVTTITMSYTNSDGVAGRTATISSFPATAVAGTFVPFNLAAGDRGVRSIQSITLGTSLAGGAVALVAYRRITSIPTPLANVGFSLDAISLGMPKCFDNTVPFFVYLLTSTAAGATTIGVTWAQG